MLMLTDFFKPTEFVRMNLSPQGTPFTAADFADNVVIPLASPGAQ
jgi:hypothetical protein